MHGGSDIMGWSGVHCSAGMHWWLAKLGRQLVEFNVIPID